MLKNYGTKGLYPPYNDPFSDLLITLRIFTYDIARLVSDFANNILISYHLQNVVSSWYHEPESATFITNSGVAKLIVDRIKNSNANCRILPMAVLIPTIARTVTMSMISILFLKFAAFINYTNEERIKSP